ncbi:prepilin peptidase [Rhodobacteraceae bacterium HSP-20]|uniref:Prepilin peptidase n=1 Tax=Paragemmobacter amnigenus TaxID=2852097 RepID=A0ABS6J656_9RHOB|nr:prepilin peptidase [Rhodobacter amnigenus]MBU9699230.1 prepilin peptidase [Rhodobacter amnigenus]MBV4390457.1 prepilin peptidase [Rhodobacter amnigenus]
MLVVSDFPSAQTALWLLPPALAIGIWVAWSDMKFMKIPNTAVLALAGAYVVLGLPALPFDLYLWGLALGAITLVAGFLVATLRLVGAGDAKFAAAMAPYFAGSSLSLVSTLFAGCLIAAFLAHRLLRALPAFRRATPDWESWTHVKFPMGLALSGTIIFYFVIALLISARISP